MKRTSAAISTVALNMALLAVSAVLITPLAWMAWAALHDGSSIGLGNFAVLFREHPYARWLLNSLFVCSLQTAAVVVTSALAGFALAKYRFPGRRLISVLMLGTLLLPSQVLLPATYALVLRLGWADTFAAVMVPGSVSVFGAFLFRQSMRRVPDDLIAAARIDGCSELRIWWEVALPIVRPMIGAYTLLAFVAAWNGYLWPATVLLDESRYTLAVGIANLSGLPQYETRPGVLMAATLAGVLPPVVLFLWLQRDFVAGLSSGAVKE
jgi:ABC-type glycerol-3-phosphate transport system permease component